MNTDYLNHFIADMKANRSSSVMWHGAYIGYEEIEGRVIIKICEPESLTSVLKKLVEAIEANQSESVNGNLSG